MSSNILSKLLVVNSPIVILKTFQLFLVIVFNFLLKRNEHILPVKTTISFNNILVMDNASEEETVAILKVVLLLLASGSISYSPMFLFDSNFSSAQELISSIGVLMKLAKLFISSFPSIVSSTSLNGSSDSDGYNLIVFPYIFI